jgi:DNA-directed RNA polymerase alpha subunit
MNDLRQAAEMALKYFEDAHGLEDAEVEIKEALRQALAQSEQEQKTPLKVLNLTVFTENRLRNGRVYDVDTLQTMTNKDILAIPDMGKKALKEVLEALDAYAIQTKQEKNT